MVPAVGVEPTRCCHHGILSPARLPIPSSRRNGIIVTSDPYDFKSDIYDFKVFLLDFFHISAREPLVHDWNDKQRRNGRVD